MILTPFESLVSIGINAITRHYEFAADKFAVELQDMVKGRKDERYGPPAGPRAHLPSREEPLDCLG